MAREFQNEAADTFVRCANNEPLEKTELEVEPALPPKRAQKKKSIPREMSQHETASDAETLYKVNAHNRIMDAVT